MKKQLDKLKLYGNLPNNWRGVFKSVNNMENKKQTEEHFYIIGGYRFGTINWNI